MFKKEIILAMLALSLLGINADCAVKPEIVAHRGSSFTAPENTMASINLAWKQNADAVEIDVYLTSDKQIVLSHDGNTKRTAKVNYEIAKTSYAVLSHLDVGKWKGAEYSGEKIPLFSEALATIPRGKRMFVEIKCGPDIVPYFIDEFKKSHKSSKQVAVISFSASVIKAIKEAYPEFEAYWLAGPTPENRDSLIATAKECKADGLDLAATPSMDAAYASKIREANLGLYVWTVDDINAGKNLAKMGVDGITTNRPDEMLKALKAE